MTEHIKQVTIERMGSNECGIAHLPSGKTVFVPYAAPQDVLSISITKEEARLSYGRIDQIEQASPLRTKPACPHFEQCGACSWQHLQYSAQLSAKEAVVRNALERIGKLSQNKLNDALEPIIASKREMGYRNKLEFAVGKNAQGRLDLGFNAPASHDIISIDTCPLAVTPLQKSSKALRGALRYLEGQGDLQLFRVGIRASLRTKDLELALWTSPCGFPRAEAVKVLRSALPQLTSIVRVIADQGKARKVKKVEQLFGKGYWEEKLDEARFCTSAPSFFQVNTAQAEQLIRQVKTYLGGDAALDGAYIADLYAGGGTFSIPLAQANAEVVAIEAAGSSVRDLRRNAENNNVYVEVIGGDAAREIKSLDAPDALVVDPPRAGLDASVVSDIVAFKPEKLIYVSCDPATLARDVKRFAEQGYFLQKARPVDMFPQTFHVETVALLAR